MQGVGNDFVLVDARALAMLDWAALAPKLCDRRFGVGSDGLLVIEHSSVADLRMRMFNPDGTEDFCGNGLRCVARYVSEDSPAEMTIETIAGSRHASVQKVHPVHPDSPPLGGRGVGGWGVTVDMGSPQFIPTAIPMAVDADRVLNFPLEVLGETLTITALSTGTAHTIIFADRLPESPRFEMLSAAIEHHSLFPERTSVMWTKVESRSQLSLRIWERGGGETWGCGSGACAAAVAARVHGLADTPVTVSSRGGDLAIDWTEGGRIAMTGPAEKVYAGVWKLD